MSSDPTLILIITQLKQGQTAAFKKLYDLYYGKLYHYCLKFLKSEEATQEVLQEVFLKLWMVRQNIDPFQNFDAYIFTVARNQTLDYLKELSKNQKKKVQFLAAVQGRHHSLRCQTDESLSFSEYMACSQQAINKLPSQRKLIFQLSRYDGLSHDEIANRLGISKNTVKVQMFRAMKAIKEHLKAYADLSLVIGLLLLSR